MRHFLKILSLMVMERAKNKLTRTLKLEFKKMIMIMESHPLRMMEWILRLEKICKLIEI